MLCLVFFGRDPDVIPMTAGKLIDELKKVDPNTKVILASGNDEIATSVRMGKYEFAHGYIEKDDYVGSPEENVESVLIIS
jgi:DNA-binding NarL/FixJ family response regulator